MNLYRLLFVAILVIASAAIASAQMATAKYICDPNAELTADFMHGRTKTVRIRYGTQDFTLPLVRSGSGSKYQRGRTMFWVKGDEAQLTSRVLDATCHVVKDSVDDARKVDVSDLVGARGSSGEMAMGTRGFRNVDGFKSGTTSYTIWWNGETHQCIQIATANGRYDSVQDIKTHPRCVTEEEPRHVADALDPVAVDDLVGARASSGEMELGKRGFQNVDGMKSGTTSYTIWYNRMTRQCIQVATANGRYDSVKDIQTHPKCK